MTGGEGGGVAGCHSIVKVTVKRKKRKKSHFEFLTFLQRIK